MGELKDSVFAVDRQKFEAAQVSAILLDSCKLSFDVPFRKDGFLPAATVGASEGEEEPVGFTLKISLVPNFILRHCW